MHPFFFYWSKKSHSVVDDMMMESITRKNLLLFHLNKWSDCTEQYFDVLTWWNWLKWNGVTPSVMWQANVYKVSGMMTAIRQSAFGNIMLLFYQVPMRLKKRRRERMKWKTRKSWEILSYKFKFIATIINCQFHMHTEHHIPHIQHRVPPFTIHIVFNLKPELCIFFLAPLFILNIYDDNSINWKK